MRYGVLILLLILVGGLYAEGLKLECGTPNGGPAYTGFVEFAAADAWGKCDMRCSGQPGPFHIMLMGDSVGALLAASPSPIAWQIDGVKSKSWDNFLNNPPPTGAKNWRVLNTAVSASTAHIWRYLMLRNVLVIIKAKMPGAGEQLRLVESGCKSAGMI